MPTPFSILPTTMPDMRVPSLVTDHVEHRAGGEAHRVGRDRIGYLDSSRAEDGEGDFDQTGPNPHEGGVEVGAQPDTEHGDGDRETFTYVLQADSQHEFQGVRQVSRTEAHSNRQTLRYVVQRDRQDEKPHSRDTTDVQTLTPQDRLQVRCQTVRDIQNDCTQCKAKQHRDNPTIVNPRRIKLVKLAVSMIPAAKPSAPSKCFSVGFRQKSTRRVPTVLRNVITSPATRP